MWSFGLETWEIEMPNSGLPTSPSPVSQSREEHCSGSCFSALLCVPGEWLALSGPALLAVSEGLISSLACDLGLIPRASDITLGRLSAWIPHTHNQTEEGVIGTAWR